MTIATPCLAGACNNVKDEPVVFTFVQSPLLREQAKRRQPPALCSGVGGFPPVGHTLDLMQKLVPELAAVGIMYNPAEANSVKELSVARDVYRSRGVRLEEVAIAGSSEVLQAVQILAGRKIQRFGYPGAEPAINGYEGAVKGAHDAHLPLVTDECSSIQRGGLACLGVIIHAAAFASGRLAGRVLQGANPKDLPFEEVAVEEMFISRSNAEQLGITIPAEYSQNIRP